MCKVQKKTQWTGVKGAAAARATIGSWKHHLAPLSPQHFFVTTSDFEGRKPIFIPVRKLNDMKPGNANIIIYRKDDDSLCYKWILAIRIATYNRRRTTKCNYLIKESLSSTPGVLKDEGFLAGLRAIGEEEAILQMVHFGHVLDERKLQGYTFREVDKPLRRTGQILRRTSRKKNTSEEGREKVPQRDRLDGPELDARRKKSYFQAPRAVRSAARKREKSEREVRGAGQRRIDDGTLFRVR
ncbi:hypothetical protein GWI33_001944 [Rhynchophorus ferrugineus]|uniref:Uncharacterized protein n=1 Tax=Rhynchophorus ferrugineus TaxID=354439 RepID=A0A834MHT9_RHYFE|nr:hypothetical protein GWI33_001944 [Rhynchophorus ferrugineus]